MSQATQPKKFTIDFSHGSMHFDKRKDVEGYRDELIMHLSPLALAMSEGGGDLLTELNLDLNNKLYECMKLLAESEACDE